MLVIERRNDPADPRRLRRLIEQLRAGPNAGRVAVLPQRRAALGIRLARALCFSAALGAGSREVQAAGHSSFGSGMNPARKCGYLSCDRNEVQVGNNVQSLL